MVEADHRRLGDQRRQPIQPVHVLWNHPGVNAEGGQHQGAVAGKLLGGHIRARIEGDRDREDAVLLDLATTDAASSP